MEFGNLLRDLVYAPRTELAAFQHSLQQAIARYTWDGETANGMMERSIPGDQLESS